MNYKSDLQKLGLLENLPDYTIFKRKTPKKLVSFFKPKKMHTWHLCIAHEKLMLVNDTLEAEVLYVENTMIYTNKGIYELVGQINAKMMDIKLVKLFENGVCENFEEIARRYLEMEQKSTARIKERHTEEKENDTRNVNTYMKKDAKITNILMTANIHKKDNNVTESRDTNIYPIYRDTQHNLGTESKDDNNMQNQIDMMYGMDELFANPLNEMDSEANIISMYKQEIENSQNKKVEQIDAPSIHEIPKPKVFYKRKSDTNTIFQEKYKEPIEKNVKKITVDEYINENTIFSIPTNEPKEDKMPDNRIVAEKPSYIPEKTNIEPLIPVNENIEANVNSDNIVCDGYDQVNQENELLYEIYGHNYSEGDDDFLKTSFDLSKVTVDVKDLFNELAKKENAIEKNNGIFDDIANLELNMKNVSIVENIKIEVDKENIKRIEEIEREHNKSIQIGKKQARFDTSLLQKTGALEIENNDQNSKLYGNKEYDAANNMTSIEKINEKSSAKKAAKTSISRGKQAASKVKKVSGMKTESNADQPSASFTGLNTHNNTVNSSFDATNDDIKLSDTNENATAQSQAVESSMNAKTADESVDNNIYKLNLLEQEFIEKYNHTDLIVKKKPKAKSANKSVVVEKMTENHDIPLSIRVVDELANNKSTTEKIDSITEQDTNLAASSGHATNDTVAEVQPVISTVIEEMKSEKSDTKVTSNKRKAKFNPIDNLRKKGKTNMNKSMIETKEEEKAKHRASLPATNNASVESTKTVSENKKANSNGSSVTRKVKRKRITMPKNFKV